MAHQAAPAPQMSSSNTGKKTPPSVMGVPLAKWAISAISAIFVCYVAFHYAMKGYSEYEKVKQENAQLVATTATLKSQNTNLANKNAALKQTDQEVTAQSGATTDCARQWQDNPQAGISMRLPPEAGSGIRVTLFKKDGCIHLVRDGAPIAYGISLGQDLWIPDLSKTPSPLSSRRIQPFPGPPTGDPLNLNVGTSESSTSRSGTLLFPLPDPPRGHLLVASYLTPKVAPQFSTVQLPNAGKCVNPHPGRFTWKWGTPNGCVVPLYRYWKDGCQHSQLYNTCSGRWDKQINWLSCSGPPHH